jgi:DNA-binding MarR family transcriptional regulator
MEGLDGSRGSSEYAELVADVFVETVRKAAASAMCGEHGEEEITPSLMQCLEYVYLRGASQISRIADGLEVSLSAASQLVERLVKRELVTRHENEDDRRLTRVELAEAGESLVREMRERRARWFQSIVTAMPEDKRVAMLEGLESFLKIALARQGNAERACVKCGMEHVPFCVVNEVKTERSDNQ